MKYLASPRNCRCQTCFSYFGYRNFLIFQLSFEHRIWQKAHNPRSIQDYANSIIYLSLKLWSCTSLKNYFRSYLFWLWGELKLNPLRRWVKTANKIEFRVKNTFIENINSHFRARMWLLKYCTVLFRLCEHGEGVRIYLHINAQYWSGFQGLSSRFSDIYFTTNTKLGKKNLVESTFALR